MRLMGARGTSGVCHTVEMNKASSSCVVADCCCYQQELPLCLRKER